MSDVLTQEELENLREFMRLMPPAEDDSAATIYVRQLLAHTEAQVAKLKRLRGIVGELTTSKYAGTEWWDNPAGDWGWTCVYCGVFTSRGRAVEPEPERLTHAPTCPIVRGREAVKGADDADPR